MDDKERYDRGLSKRRKVLGKAHVDRAIANKNAFNSEFQDFITPMPGARSGSGRISTSARGACW